MRSLHPGPDYTLRVLLHELGVEAAYFSAKFYVGSLLNFVKVSPPYSHLLICLDLVVKKATTFKLAGTRWLSASHVGCMRFLSIIMNLLLSGSCCLDMKLEVLSQPLDFAYHVIHSGHRGSWDAVVCQSEEIHEVLAFQRLVSYHQGAFSHHARFDLW